MEFQPLAGEEEGEMTFRVPADNIPRLSQRQNTNNNYNNGTDSFILGTILVNDNHVSIKVDRERRNTEKGTDKGTERATE